MFETGLVSVIAYQRVHQDADLFCVNKDAGMAKVPHTDKRSIIFPVGRVLYSRKESVEEVPILFTYTAKVCNPLNRSRNSLHFTQFVYAGMVKGDIQMQYMRFIQSRCTQAKGPVVVIGNP